MEGQMDNSKQKYSILRCVVCNGFGTLKYGGKICQGCNGKGFVVINNDTGFQVEQKEENGDA